MLSSLVVLCLTTAALAGTQPKGNLVLIGGGEKPAEAMRKFVELAGGPQALIVAIPTASEEPDTGEYYVKLFKEQYGCANVVALDVKTKEDAMRADFAETAAKASGIFFGGGDQSRITRALLDTPVGAAIADAFARGAVVGGTSAGTACQSALMITGEGDFKVVRADAVELSRGLGFFRGVIVDQHFIARQRSNRLISVILEHPDLLGVGIDEGTAVWVRPDNTFRVMGSSCVMVLDPAGAEVQRKPGGKEKGLLGVHDLRVHILLPGETFDVSSRSVVRTDAAPAAAGSPR
ncbi:MAG: cyanophycinase [Acidobacteriota bacterium]